GVLVFQATGLELKEMRGFSISEKFLPTITLNTKDSPRGRVFTLLHELTHLALREAGVCNLIDSGNGENEEEANIETFCNAVAGAILIPLDKLLSEDLLAQNPDVTTWSDQQLFSI